MARRGFSNMKPKTGGNDSLRLEEIIEIYKLTDHPDEWVQLRFLDSDILPVKRHWVKIYAGKEKRVVGIPRFCLKFNPENEDEPFPVHCPYCDLSTEGGQEATMRNENFYLVNAIVRDLQEDEPARKAKPTAEESKTKYKDIKSKAWTPVRVIRLTNTVVARMQELGETNIVKNKKSGEKKAFDVSHPKFGCDINVKYKPKAAGTDKYSADKAEGRTPLTDEEKDYLVWPLNGELLDAAGRMSETQAAEDFKRMEVVGAETIDEEEEDEDMDEDDIPLESSKKSKKNPAKKESLSDDDDDDDDGDDDEPVKPSKKKPVTKKKAKKKPSFEDEDDDEDDEPAPAKKKKKPAVEKKAKKKPVVEDDDDDDDDDGDDEPVKPKKKKIAKKAKDSGKKKKKKSAMDDDDDDWDDD